MVLDKRYFQAILEAQKNIDLVLEEGTIRSANKAFLTFFAVRSVEDFYNQYENFCDLLVQESTFPVCSKADQSWSATLLANPHVTHTIKLRKDDKIYIFMVGVSDIEDTAYRVLSLTDITSIENERRMYELAASTDALTGLANRLKFNTILEQQLALSKRYKETFSLVLFDVDNFKKVNDTYGHTMGDEVLITIAEIVKKYVRDSDTCARWGGEEFVLVLPQTSENEAYELAETIRKIIASVKFGEGFHVTCSFGVREYSNQANSDIFMNEVDILLYKAKNSGKDKVCLL